MIELGKVQKLKVVKEVAFGVFLGTEDEKVLLPRKYVPEGTKQGDEVEVFIYKDTLNRLIATSQIPMITLGEVEKLEVKEVTEIGAFVSWGIDKDLFIPYREQTCKLEVGKKYLFALYIDKSERLAGTMKVYNYMKPIDREVRPGEYVRGRIYEIKELGAFVAVDNKYFGLIPAREVRSDFEIGMKIEARVTRIREDGKLDLCTAKHIVDQIEMDIEKVLEVIRKCGGKLPYNDKVSPEIIDRDFAMSKGAFKRAVGRLYKERRIVINPDSIVLIKEDNSNEENN